MKRILTAVVLVAALCLGGLAHAGTMTFTASTIQVAARQNAGSLIQIRGTATFSASYAAGGDTLTPASVGLNRIVWIDVPGTDTSGGRLLTAVQPTSTTITTKIKCYTALTPTECAGSQATITVPITVWGY